MPRRLALLTIAWLACVSSLFAQGQGEAPPGYSGMPGLPPGPTMYQRQPLQAQRVPAPRPYYEESPLEVAVGDVIAESWVSVEYLNIRLRDPGERTIGAQASTAATSPLFQATDRGGAARPGILARTTSLEEANYSDMNGLRLGFGLPTQMFTFEGNFWGIVEKENRVDHEVGFNSDINQVFPGPVIPTLALNPITTLTGTFQDFINFDQGMETRLSASLYGTEANFVFRPITPNVATEVSPIVGFGYLNFRNEFDIAGSDLVTATNHRIESTTNNNVFGPQIGLRFETKGKWLTIGAEPKFMFGINRNRSQLFTSQIYDPLEVDFRDEDKTTRFTPTVDLAAYLKLHLRPNLSLKLGYDYMAMNGISLADRQVTFDSTRLPTDVPAIRMDTSRHTFLMYGFNVGLDWSF